MFKFVCLMLFSAMLGNAHASYLVTSFNASSADKNLPTRILVAGFGDELGLLFQEVAAGKAMKYAELNPNEQIVLITHNEKEIGNNEWELKRWGFKVIDSDSSTLDGRELVKELSKFKKILSLDIFSHSSAQFGIHLEGRSNHFSESTRGLDDLKPNFVKGAFVYLHGCNSGFKLAPFLSNLWGIPVAGSLTSTNFQKLHTDGNFYLTEEGYAPNSDWAKENALSFPGALKCSTGACQRLKPDNTNYFGFWGAYREGGLPFYKFFCVRNSAEDCLRAMSKSMLTHTLIVDLKKNSPLSDYKKAVVDFLCPISSKSDLRGECQAKLEEALITKDMSYNPFTRPQIECDFKTCKAEISCEKVLFTGVPKPGSCVLKNNAGKAATTLVREYQSYLQAFQYLSK